MSTINSITNIDSDVNSDNNKEKYEFNPLEVKPENIPDELKELPYWCPWKLVWDKDNPSKKPKKIPINPNTGEWLKSDHPEDWVPYDVAIAAYQSKMKYDGIGILLTEEDYFVGIDIDDCISDDAPNAQVADDIIGTLDSYTEVSPSGNGLRMFCKRGKKSLQLKGNKTDQAEMYWNGHLLTVTGWVGDAEPAEIRRCPGAIKKIHKKYIVNGKSAPAAKQITSNDQTVDTKSTGYGDTSPSGLDFALCCKLIKQGHSEEEVKQLLVSKGSNNKKYERPDYVDRTVQAAFEKVEGVRGTGVKTAKTSNKTTLRSSVALTDWRSMPSIDHATVAAQDIPEPKWLITDWLRHDSYVGQVVGEQQTGKSYLLTVFSYCLACGRSFGQFEIPEPRRVIYINVEDPKDQIDFRCKQVMLAMEFTTDELTLIYKNLKIQPWIGRFGAINKTGTENWELNLLNNMIADFNPDLIIGDTKSRLSGGDENSNNTQAELVRTLEQLAIQYSGVFLMAHHPNKGNVRSSRGGGAWESNIRLTINLVKMDKKTAQDFGFTTQEAHDRAFVMTCNDNYGGRNIAYFYKDPDTGLPRPIMPEHYTSEIVQEWLLAALKEHGEVNRRKLVQTRGKDDDVVAAMLETFPMIRGGKKDAIKDAVEKLLEDDRICEIKKGKSSFLTTKRPAPKLKLRTNKEKKSQ